jgi:hypothetical protein
MEPSIRRVFFFVYAIFFVILTPFLVFISLGYDIDFERFQLNRTLKLEVDTIPRNADIYNQSKKIFESPASAKVLGNIPIELSIVEKNFVDEKFVLWSSQESNESVLLRNLGLLPNSSIVLSQNQNFTPVTLLREGFVVLASDNIYQIQGFSFNGMEGVPLPIVNIGKQIITKGHWEFIANNFYYKADQGLILYRQGNTWFLKKVDTIANSRVIQIAVVNERSIFVLNEKSELWSLNLSSDIPTFVDSNIQGVKRTLIPSVIWIHKYDKVYSVESDNLDSSNYQVEERNIFIQDIRENSNQKFDVLNVNNGIIFKFDQVLMFVPDNNDQKKFILTNNSATAKSFDDIVYWVDYEKNLWSYNFYLQDIDRYGKLNTTTNAEQLGFMDYYPSWNRLFIYSGEEVFSVWNDIKTDNESILEYSNTKWINGASCQVRIIEKSQVCISGNLLILYSNNNIF